jgi:hypothetical protein
MLGHHLTELIDLTVEGADQLHLGCHDRGVGGLHRGWLALIANT